MKICLAGLGPVARGLGRVGSAHGHEVVVWGAPKDELDGFVASGIAARTTVFPQDELETASMLIVDGDGELLGRICRTYLQFLAPEATLVHTAHPTNDALRTLAELEVQHTTAAISPVSTTRWLVDIDGPVRELVRPAGVEALEVPARHHDLWRAATELVPGLVGAALHGASDELGPICPHLDAEGTRLSTLERSPFTVEAVIQDRQAALTVLPRVISVLQDTMRWLEFKETERLAALLEES